MTYLTRPVFEFEMDWSERPAKEVTFDLRELALGFGSQFFNQLQQHTAQGYDFSVRLTSPESVVEFDAFTAALKGRLAGFWLPVPFKAVQIVAGVSTTQFNITDQNLRDTIAEHPDVYLYLTRPGLAPRACKVASVVLLSPGIERVTLTAALGVAANEQDTAVRLHYVRLANDEEEGEFYNESRMTRRVRVIELPTEYEAFETGESPIWLYHFWTAAPMDRHWRFTSFAASVVSGNELFTAYAIRHGSQTKSARLDNEQLSIDARYDAAHPFALFLPIPMSSVLNVEVLKVTLADPETSTLEFTGVVARVVDKNDRLMATCESWAALLSRKLPRMNIQRDCNHALFNSGTCKVARYKFEITGTVASVDNDAAPPTVTLDFDRPTSAQYPKWITADWFANGFVEAGLSASYQVRTILSSAALGGSDPKQIVLELAAPLDVEIGDRISIIPGCDGKAATCRTKFANFANFGGFPGVPEKNLSLQAVDAIVSQGGKK